MYLQSQVLQSCMYVYHNIGENMIRLTFNVEVVRGCCAVLSCISSTSVLSPRLLPVRVVHPRNHLPGNHTGNDVISVFLALISVGLYNRR